MKELRDLGKKAVTPLKKALAASRSAEFARRAQILLEPFLPVKTRPRTIWDRCFIMQEMQVGVYNRTRALAKAIAANPGKKPNRANKKEALALADEEQKIIREADQAIQFLKAKGTAIAFEAAVAQLRDDMKTVQKRLWATDVGKYNQAYQLDVIETLSEMMKALQPRHRR
jgi:hypothetical protein